MHVLPEDYKVQALEQLHLTIKYMSDLGFKKTHIHQIEMCIPWLNSKHTWHENHLEIKEEIQNRIQAKFDQRIDTLRGEDFMVTFPELGALYKVPESLRP